MPCNDDHDRDDDSDHHHHHLHHHRDHHGIEGRQVQVMEGGRRWKLEALHGFPGLLATLPTGLVFPVMIDMMNMAMAMVGGVRLRIDTFIALSCYVQQIAKC